MVQKELQAKLDEHKITTRILGQCACQIVIYEFIYAIKRTSSRIVVDHDVSDVGPYIWNNVGNLVILLNYMDMLQEPLMLEYLSIVDDISLRYHFGGAKPSEAGAYCHKIRNCCPNKPSGYCMAYYTVLIQAFRLQNLSYVYWCFDNNKTERYGKIVTRALYLTKILEPADALALTRSLFENGICHFDGREVEIISEDERFNCYIPRPEWFCDCAATPSMLSRKHILQGDVQVWTG